MRRLFTPGGYVAAGLVVLLVLVAAWWLVIGKPAADRRRSAEATADRLVAEGQANAAKDAAGVITGSAERQNERSELTRENRDAILAAPGASAPVDPGLGAAGRRALCLRDAYRGKPPCV